MCSKVKYIWLTVNNKDNNNNSNNNYNDQHLHISGSESADTKALYKSYINSIIIIIVVRKSWQLLLTLSNLNWSEYILNCSDQEKSPHTRGKLIHCTLMQTRTTW